MVCVAEEVDIDAIEYVPYAPPDEDKADDDGEIARNVTEGMMAPIVAHIKKVYHRL